MLTKLDAYLCITVSITDLLARRSQVLKLPLFDIVTYVLWCYVSPIHKMMVAMKD